MDVRLLDEAVLPVTRMPTVMLESEDTNMISSDTIVDRIRKPTHEIAPNVRVDDLPSFGSLDNGTNGLINSLEKLSA